MSQYTPISLPEMRDVLRAQNGWVEIPPSTLLAQSPQVREYVFEFPFTKVGSVVKVYTSIALTTGMTRSVGADAIRVCVPNWVSSEQRVHRVAGWHENLKTRVREVMKEAVARFEEKGAKLAEWQKNNPAPV